MHRKIFFLLTISLFLLSQNLFAHNERNMRREIYTFQMAKDWNRYEETADSQIKKQILEQLIASIENHNLITPVTQLREQQNEIIDSLSNSVNLLLESLNKSSSPEQSNQIQILEQQVQKNIFAYLEFEKTISDFKSEQFWKMTRIILLVLVIFILATIFLTYSYNNAKQRAKRQKEFNNKIIQVQEEERKRLSRELHDTVTQDIRTVLLFVRNLRDLNPSPEDEEKTLIENIEKLETQNLINIRNIIQNLTPPEIEAADLHNLLTEYCNNVVQITKLKCTFFAEKGLDFSGFNSFQKLNILRIVQEAVTNSIKHAHASEINILARKKAGTSNRFVFFVSDDGCGFSENAEENQETDIAKKSTHLGLQGMKARAQLIDADLRIFSEEDCGTEIRFEVSF
ncbi:MAG: hypothetical protein KBT11_10475 [Treponema sp.]|nr:hypothetical protein [Candidatus Treponema equifaecale]